MRQKPNANDAQMAVQLIGQRSFKANRTTNWLIAFAAIIVIILITSTCSVFFNIQAFSNLQDLKSIGTTTDVIFSNPSSEQLAQLEENDLIQKPLYVSYKVGRLIGNIGQSGLSILIHFELRKIFSKKLTEIALIAILLLSVLFGFSTYQNKYAFGGKSDGGTGKTAVEIDKEIAAKYEGILTDEKVQQMMNDFAPKSDLHGMNAAYLYQNAMQSAAFARFSDMNGNWNGLSVSDVFGDEEIKIGYTDGWLSTSQNMVKIFIVLSLAIVIMIAPVFSCEYEGVDNIILTSKYGKTKCTTAKIVSSIFATIFSTALIVAFNLILAYMFYGKSGLDCSILFAPIEYVEGFIPFNITCGTLLKYQILLAFTGTISVMGITLLLSAISKKQIVALVASAAIYLFPVLLPVSETNPLFRYIVLLPLYQTQAISLMSVEQMSNGMLYAVWAVPVSLIFLGIGIFVSRRAFAKHQVS